MSGQPRTTSKVQNMSSGMTPRGLTAGLTPTMNFAMDFGKGNNRKEDGTPLDAGNGTFVYVIICRMDLIFYFVTCCPHVKTFPLV